MRSHSFENKDNLSPLVRSVVHICRNAYPRQRHQIVIELEISRPNGGPAHHYPDDNKNQPERHEDETLNGSVTGRHGDNGSDSDRKLLSRKEPGRILKERGWKKSSPLGSIHAVSVWASGGIPE